MAGISAVKPINLMVTIVDRGKSEKVVSLLRQHRMHFHITLLGMGTASSEILSVFGLGERAKDVVLSTVLAERSQEAAMALAVGLALHKPGSGICFTIPLSCVCSHSALPILSCQSEPDTSQAPNTQTTGKIIPDESVKDEGLNMKQAFELIISIVNQGFSDQVMDAARKAGASGGTILHARGAGIHEAEKFFGIAIQPEKEVVLLLVPKVQRAEIMSGIARSAGLNTEGRGLAFSLPVEDVTGIVHLLKEES